LKYNLGLLLFFFLFSIVLFSQGYLVHHYTESDGLPSAEVYDMTQDQWGRLSCGFAQIWRRNENEN